MIKLEIKTPKGWRRLKAGEAFNRGDMVPSCMIRAGGELVWEEVPRGFYDRTSGSDYVQTNDIAIRKKPLTRSLQS